MQLQKELELQTGDLILFRGTSWISTILEYVGKSKYSHIGIVIKNPRFLNENLEDGLYLLDSSFGSSPDVEDGRIKYGVQLHKLDDILAQCSPKSVYVRKITATRDQAFYEKFAQVHKDVYDKPYDLHICVWIEAKLNMDAPIPVNTVWRWTNRFWCSALVSYIYCKVGWISECNWGIIAPREYSSTDCTGQVIFTCIISDEDVLF